MSSRAGVGAVCVPLVARSAFSLGRGTAPLPALVERAAEFGYPALALTDRDNLYGMVEFRREAERVGVRPIAGAEITGLDPATPRAVALVRTMSGYSNLCKILTRRMLDGAFDLAAALIELHDGLHLLTDDEGLARALHPHLPAHRLWLLLADPPRRADDGRRLAALGRELNRPLVASPDVVYLEEADRPIHRLLGAIRERELVSRAERLMSPAGSGLPRPHEIVERFRDFPGALVANRLIREECADFELSLGRPIFPKCPLPPGETAYSWLFHLCLEGMRTRYGGCRPDAMHRLARELEVIDRLGFPEYFIIVGEICRHAHRQGIPTVGRGSGAGSIVTYLLGITNVCPLRYRLYFERFLHDQRKDLPDLDIDLCWRRRDDVIQHVYETYGAGHVAMISTHNTFGARGAFRDVARAHGVAPDTVDRWSRLIPRNGEAPLARLLAQSPRGRDVPLEEPRFQRLLADADRLIGLPRHLGIHPGGIVITDRPIDHYTPLEEAAKGIVVTQYEMRAAEAIGLIKIDLLGNRAISVISEAVELVRAGGGPVIDPAAIPDGDEATARLMSQGDTLGVFQLESPGMRNLLKQLATRDLDGAIAALSLIRPGPAGSGMKERFIRRAHGLEAVEFLDPRLAEHLGGTYGVMLYEEDVMAVSAALAGLSLADGDMLRRAVAGIESPEDEEALRRVFVARAERNDTSPAVAAQAWSEIRRFAAYSFCKAHASGYGVLAWQGSWLKAHHPAAFAVAILNNHTAMYDQRVHLEDARRHGVEIRLPCVNRSGAEFTLESEGAGPGGAIRVGLGRVRELTEATLDRTLRRRPFRDLADFLARARPMLKEAEHLILAGAFDFTGRIRPELLCELRLTWTAHMRAARGAAADGTTGLLFDVGHTVAPLPRLHDFTEAERLRREFEVLELSTDRSSMSLFDTRGFLPSDRLDAARGRRVRMAGIVAATRRVRTKRGEFMLFLTLEDGPGLFECTLFPSAWHRFGLLLRGLGPYVVEGRAEDQYGAVTLNVERLRRWEDREIA